MLAKQHPFHILIIRVLGIEVHYRKCVIHVICTRTHAPTHMHNAQHTRVHMHNTHTKHTPH